MSTRRQRVIANLKSTGRFRRVRSGRDDYKMILKNPELHRMLLRADRDMREGKGVHMTVEELRQRFGIEP
ncbi:MAG TPA: hypothetical protein VF092_27120 [Longimicrobium sp.]